MIAAPAWAAALPLPPGFPCKRDDRACALKAALSHQVKRKTFWREALAKPLAERVGEAPPALVEYLILDTINQGIPAHPRAPNLSREFLADVQAALQEIPEEVKAAIVPRLAGIYFIEDIGGTGFSDQVEWGANGVGGAGFIVLDPAQLVKRRANEWATWKESTPFKESAAWRIEAFIADEKGNTRKNAIQYILLHEFAHVLATRGDVHPNWNEPPANARNAGKRYPFYSLGWRLNAAGNNFTTLQDAAWLRRANIRYYFGANLEAEEMRVAYDWLETTGFASLYGATSPGDDFAEAFVTYVHTVLMKRPWAIRIHHNGKLVKTVNACWDQPRCAEKRRVLEQILGIKQ